MELSRWPYKTHVPSPLGQGMWVGVRHKTVHQPQLSSGDLSGTQDVKLHPSHVTIHWPVVCSWPTLRRRRLVVFTNEDRREIRI